MLTSYLYLIAFPLVIINQKCDKEYSGSRQSTWLWVRMYEMIANSDINNISTFHGTFLDLSYAQLTGYSTSVNKVDRKPINLKNVLASFAMANHLQNDRSFSSHLLPFQKVK